MSFVTWMDNCPLWLKIVFALPGLDLIWGIYRLVKGLSKGKTPILLGGILWIITGWAILWIIDIVTIIISHKVTILA